MNLEIHDLILGAVIALPVLFVVMALVVWKKPRRLKVDKYRVEWKELQSFCRDRTMWPKALVDADRLLDKALKRRKFRGKRMGERLVSAQRRLTNNDGVWAAHNLTKKVIDNPATRLSEAKVKAALVAYRQALIDIGALPDGQSRNS